MINIYLYCHSDINECANETLYSCAGNSTCVNMEGSYRCKCDSGFKGNGAVECRCNNHYS